MMENREIKFRGLHEATGVWIEGDLYHRLNEEIYINHVIPTGENSRENKLTKVKKGTESQFTGLKDKNGVEIYENDVIDYYYKDQAIRGVVQFGKVSWCIFYKTPKGFDRLNRLSPKAEIEVIGNIYENPELL